MNPVDLSAKQCNVKVAIEKAGEDDLSLTGRLLLSIYLQVTLTH